MDLHEMAELHFKKESHERRSMEEELGEAVDHRCAELRKLISEES